MRRACALKPALSVALLILALAGGAMALTNASRHTGNADRAKTARQAPPREERLVFPNVTDDAGEDMYSPLIFSFVAGAVLVGGVRTIVVRRRRVEEPVVRRVLG